MTDQDMEGTAPPEDMRTTPLAWDELAPFSVAGTIELVGWVLEGAEQAYIKKTEPHYHTEWVTWGVLGMLSEEQGAALIAYAVERRPAPEVLFNKSRELGYATGQWDDLMPVDRASFELAARIIPAIAEAAEAVNAQLVAKCPPAAPAYAERPVDLEDTILEQVDGIADIDPQRAAAQDAADRAAANKAKTAKPKGKKRAIDAGAA